MEFVIGIAIIVIALVILMVASYVKAPLIPHLSSPVIESLEFSSVRPVSGFLSWSVWISSP